MSKSPKKRVKKKKRKVRRAYIQVGVADFKDRILRYSDLERDDAGWVTNLRYRPINFDLVFLKLRGRDKSLSAWWTGEKWDGRLWKPIYRYRVLAWKRNENWD